jgi:hypothetical protein
VLPESAVAGYAPIPAVRGFVIEPTSNQLLASIEEVGVGAVRPAKDLGPARPGDRSSAFAALPSVIGGPGSDFIDAMIDGAGLAASWQRLVSRGRTFRVLASLPLGAFTPSLAEFGAGHIISEWRAKSS